MVSDKCDDCRLYVCGICDGIKEFDLIKCSKLRKDALKN